MNYTFDQLSQTINQWLLLEDQGLIKILVASLLVNRLPDDPVWLIIVAPPGSAKTELLRGLKDLDKIYFISDLTEQTLLSGDRQNKNASLLHRIPDNSILILKDFSTVLSMNPEKQATILAQLREIYDGFFSKEFGTGESKKWRGKLGLIAAATSAIDKRWSVYQSLGERFIQYRPCLPDPFKVAKQAIDNTGKEEFLRSEINSAYTRFFSQDFGEAPALTAPFVENVIHLAAFTVRARSTVGRDGYSREIDFIPQPESPARLSKQLIGLAKGLALISGKYTNEDYQLIFKVGMDSIPQKRKAVILCLPYTPGASLAEIAAHIGYPTNTTRKTLEELCALKIIVRSGGGRGAREVWSLHPEVAAFFNQFSPDCTGGTL
ncbi:hypothetical protein KGQ71_03615 [Patescibacteria group bacterium]|nr:hypothetical protein [Patescibacteria group bacterium]